MQANEPDDFLIVTGEDHSVRDFVSMAFDPVGLNWEDYVSIDERYSRPAEVDALRADTAKVEAVLGWKAKTNSVEPASEIVDVEMSARGLGS